MLDFVLTLLLAFAKHWPFYRFFQFADEIEDRPGQRKLLRGCAVIFSLAVLVLGFAFLVWAR
jgi:hypothetical protein